MKRTRARAIAAVLTGLALAACNNESGFVSTSPPAAPLTAEGVYSGTINSGPLGATDFLAMVLEDGSFWTLYGQAGASDFAVLGFAAGSGTSNDGVFTSTSGTDFGATPPAAFTLNVNYNAVLGTIDGHFTTGTSTSSLNGGAISSGPYEYSSAPNSQLLTGTWTVQGTDGASYDLVVAADGTFSFAEEGSSCTGTGAFTPRASGKNVFDVSVQFADDPGCADQAGAATGVALAYPLTGTTSIQLVAAVNDHSAYGIAISGTHPSP